MANALPQYQNPEDIKAYGRMVQGFSSAAKDLAGLKKTIEALRATLTQAVGEGRYNAQNEERNYYIIYGPQKAEAARHNNTGLFGGFFYVHLPELSMSLYGPKLLGKAGCQLRATVDDETVSIPLHKLSFWFIPNPRGPDQPADVIIDKDYGPLKAGTKIMRGRHWIRESETQPFDIVDASGRSLEESAAALVLWSHLTAQGFKKHGRNSVIYQTLAAIKTNGVNDDFAAEGFLIAWLQSVKKHNGIDLMPAFNDYVYKVHLILLENPEFLDALAQGLAIARSLGHVVQKYPLLETGASHDEPEKTYNSLSFVADRVEGGFTETARLLGLPMVVMPPADYATPISNAVATLAGEINARRWGKISINHTSCITQTGPFSLLWPDGKGNVLRSGSKLEINRSILSQFMPGLYEEIRDKQQTVMLQRAQKRLGAFIVRLDTTIRDLRYWGGAENKIEACEGAKLSLRLIKDKIARLQEIGDLREEVETIRAAYNAAKNSDLIIEGAARAKMVQKANQAPKKIRKAVNTQTRAARKNSLKTFEGLKQFLDFMDAIGCDGDKWIRLYGICPDLEPQAPAGKLQNALGPAPVVVRPALAQGAAYA